MNKKKIFGSVKNSFFFYIYRFPIFLEIFMILYTLMIFCHQNFIYFTKKVYSII